MAVFSCLTDFIINLLMTIQIVLKIPVQKNGQEFFPLLHIFSFHNFFVFLYTCEDLNFFSHFGMY